MTITKNDLKENLKQKLGKYDLHTEQNFFSIWSEKRMSFEDNSQFLGIGENVNI